MYAELALEDDYTQRNLMAVQATTQNSPRLYKWALGWLLKQLREAADLSQTEMGERLDGMSQAGYRKIEKGMTPTFDLYFLAYDQVGKDIVTAMTMARVIVRQIEASEAAKDRELTDSEMDAIAGEYYLNWRK